MMNSFTTPVTLGRECLNQRDHVLIHTIKEKNTTLKMTQVGNKEAFKKCFEMFLWAQSSQGSRVGFTWPFQSMAKKEWHFFSTVQKNYTFPHRTSLECLLAIESRGNYPGSWNIAWLSYVKSRSVSH